MNLRNMGTIPTPNAENAALCSLGDRYVTCIAIISRSLSLSLSQEWISLPSIFYAYTCRMYTYMHMLFVSLMYTRDETRAWP